MIQTIAMAFGSSLLRCHVSPNAKAAPSDGLSMLKLLMVGPAIVDQLPAVESITETLDELEHR